MSARLERANDWHRRIIRDLGHDLRTPITALRAGVEVALWTERTREEYCRVLASMLEEVDRLALITDALVLLGRIEAGDLAIHLAPTDLHAVAQEAVTQARQRASAHHLSLTCPDGAVWARADAPLIVALLDQLLDNAVRYTPPDTAIETSVAIDGTTAELVVEDNGPGVPDEILTHLLEPFYRADAARGRNGGPGLGLTVASAIVELHGGSIQAERGDAGGVRIRIRLPLLDSKEAT